VIKKLLTFPVDKVFPCLDLYRIYLLHPSAYEQFAGSDAGAFYVHALLAFIKDTNHPKAVLMLALRSLNNLFKNQSSAHVALKNREAILEAASHLISHADKNVRQAAITLILNYSVSFCVKDDDEGRIQAISALSTIANEEKDLQNCLRVAYALGNLSHNNEDAAELIKTLGVSLPATKDIVAAPGEADAEKHKQTIAEIAKVLAA
jgi:hypothetical protein